MAVTRMHHVGVVVQDLERATAFFLAIGLELEGRDAVGGAWVDGVVGLEDVRSDIAMVRTPDGRARLELTRFHSPESPPPVEPAASNVLGLRHLAFPVDDLEGTLVIVRDLGYDVLGTVERYEDVYLLCDVRGPEGLIIELAEELQPAS